LNGQAETTLPAEALPLISVRTILPVAQLVKRKMQAAEEKIDGQESAPVSLDRAARTNAGGDSGHIAAAVAPPEPTKPEAIGPATSRADPTQAVGTCRLEG
jgi:hypothetical protein